MIGICDLYYTVYERAMHFYVMLASIANHVCTIYLFWRFGLFLLLQQPPLPPAPPQQQYDYSRRY
jgi:hypothetical protein